MFGPAAFAATATSTVNGQGSIAVNGQTVSQPFIRVAQDSGNNTSYIGVWYLGQAVKAAGGDYTWDYSTKTFNFQIPGVDASKISVEGGVGTGNTTIQVNGVTVKKVNSFEAQDPAGGKSDITTFVPLYYVGNVFAAIGDGATWNGSTFAFKTFSTQATSFTAKQTAATKVEVDFNGTVASGTTVTLSQNGVNYNVTPTWNSTNTSVTLDTGYNLPAGTYTVTAGSLTGTVTIAAAAPAKVNITTAGFATVSNAALNFTVVDQFGNPVTTATAAGMNITAYDATKGSQVTVTPGTGDVAYLNLASAAKGDQIVVTVTDPSSGATGTATIPVVGISDIQSVTLGSASDNGTSNIAAGDTGVVLNYTATDVSGKSVTLPANTNSASGVIDGIQFVSSNPTVVSPDSFATDASGHLTFTAAASGTTTITAVDLATGEASSTTITVQNANGVGSFKIAAPSGMLTVGNTTVIPYVATDSFGNAISQANFGLTQQEDGLTITSSNPSVIPNDFSSSNPENTSDHIFFSGANNALEVTPTGSGVTTLYVYDNGTLQNSITLSVNPASYPAEINGLVTGTSGFATYFENTSGSTATFSASDLKIVDQYNQAYSPTSADTISISYVSGVSGLVTIKPTGDVATTASGAIATIHGDGEFDFAGTATTGSEVLAVTVSNGTQSATYDFTVTSVPSSAVTSYEVVAPTSLYDGVNGYPTGMSSSDYVQPITLDGKTSNGQLVNLPSSQQKPAYLTTSNPAVIQVTNGTSSDTVQGLSAGSATVSAYDGSGNKLGSASITVSDAVPVVTSVSFDESTIATTVSGVASDVSKQLVVDDQYGVQLANPAGYWISSNTGVVTGGTTLTGVASGTTTVTFVSTNGIEASATVTVS